jgi:hypothetical protein
VSLKHGQYGCGPYSNLENVISSMVTSIEGHSCFRESETSCNIYLLPWKEIPIFKEFRIFVYQNEITAISDQNLYTVNEWLNTLDDSQIKSLLLDILNHFQKFIRNKLTFLENYVMDLAIVDDIPYFIEVNPFGKDYSSGSALFHWINDFEVLTSSNSIEFRYTSSNLNSNE